MVLATRASETRGMNRKDLQHQMKRVAQCLEQAAEILELDPEGSSERQMADAAAQALLQVNEWRKQLASKKWASTFKALCDYEMKSSTEFVKLLEGKGVDANLYGCRVGK